MKVFPRACGVNALVLFVALSATVWGGDASNADQDEQAAKTSLPLSRIVLFNSGVGFFQRDGSVTGQAQVELQFDSQHINDILKSLVLQDLDGGRVSTVTYTSRDPITKTLRSFAIDLTGKPGLAEILDQVRGECVEVASPTPVSGVILGIERQEQPAGKDDHKVVEVQLLNLLTGEGLRAVPLSQVQRIKFQRPELEAELRQALAVLATSHDTQKKSVALNFNGQGERRVRVGYIQESPVWKTSYRLVLADEEAPLLQGWAIVENTTGDDWNNVQLTLVSGRPISFLMDLYQPLYVPRPTVQLELYSSLQPRVYGEAMEEDARRADDEPADAPEKQEMRESLRRGRAGALGRRAGRALGLRKDGAIPGKPAEPFPLNLSMIVSGGAGVQSMADATEVGDLFQYAIDVPVTLPRQRSAMLPIVNQSVEGERVSIYNPTVHAKYPLNGLRLKNTTGLHLMQGPITVFDEGAYAGDAQVDDTQPGAERLISYALDLDTEVEPVAKSHPQRLVRVRLAKGTLITTHDLREERTYNVQNRGTKDRQLLVEHAFRPNWKLIAPEKPAERTREVYRFAVGVKTGGNAKLVVVEEQKVSQSIALTNVGSDAAAVYLRSEAVSPKVKEALAKVVALNQALGLTQAERSRLQARSGEIDKEQSRIRQNMQRLAQNSALYGRYVKKLNDQEDEIERLTSQIEQLLDRETRQKKSLDDYLLSLEVE